MLPQHMLVPLDMLSPVDCACSYAMSLAQMLHACITLLPGIEPLPFHGWRASPEMEPIVNTYLEQCQQEHQWSIACRVKQGQNAGILCEAVVMSGAPFQILVDVARATSS
jgi:hypothetical protein